MTATDLLVRPEDRLPENCLEVLGWNAQQSKWQVVYYDTGSGEQFWFCGDEYIEFEFIKYWMYLPKLPEMVGIT